VSPEDRSRLEQIAGTVGIVALTLAILFAFLFGCCRGAEPMTTGATPHITCWPPTPGIGIQCCMEYEPLGCFALTPTAEPEPTPT
jgi:hypothetical protein